MADHSQHLGEPEPRKPERLLRLAEVLSRTGIRKTQWYALIKRGLAPRAIAVTPDSPIRVWIESEVQAFIDDRIAVARAARDAA